MATYDYSKDPVVISRLLREIDAAGLPAPTGIVHNSGETPNDLHITFSSDLDSGQQTTLGTVVTNHNGSAGSIVFPAERDYIERADAAWVSASQLKIGKSGKLSVLDDQDGNGRFSWTGELTADITASGAGGLDTGSEAVSTWYYLWAIADSTLLNAVAAMLSASASNPTLPAGYDLKRPLWADRNNDSGDFLRFEQLGRGARRSNWYIENPTALTVLDGGNATTWAEIDLTALVPPFVRSATFLVKFATGQGGGVADIGEFRPKGVTYPVFQTGAGAKSNSPIISQFTIPVPPNGLLEYRVSGSANSLTLILQGWEGDV